MIYIANAFISFYTVIFYMALPSDFLKQIFVFWDFECPASYDDPKLQFYSFTR